MKELQQKLDRLMDMLRVMDSVVIGFSGGADSSFLACYIGSFRVHSGQHESDT